MQEQMTAAKAIVIGSGIAGIASALRLRKKGYDVTVFEANEYVGGKLHTLKKEGYRWDAGPSLFTMPHLVDELFELYKLKATDYFNYQKKERVCNYFWEDNTTFSVHANRAIFVAEAAKRFNTPPEEITKYLECSQQILNTEAVY